jgi:hypothetical protein
MSKGDAWGDRKRRARQIRNKILPKTEAEDVAASQARIRAVHGGGEEDRKRLERRHKGAALLARFKKTADGYESPYTGIMLDTPRNFDTFSEPFRDAGLNIAEIQCELGKPFADCKTLQEVRDKMAGEGEYAGNPPTVIKRGKHEYSWTVRLSAEQHQVLEEYYLGKGGPQR